MERNISWNPSFSLAIFSLSFVSYPSSLFPLDSVLLTVSHIEERARRERSSKGRNLGLSVQVYTHRLDGRAWSLLHPSISPSGLSDFLIVALASDPGGNTSAIHTRSLWW